MTLKTRKLPALLLTLLLLLLGAAACGDAEDAVREREQDDVPADDDTDTDDTKDEDDGDDDTDDDDDTEDDDSSASVAQAALDKLQANIEEDSSGGPSSGPDVNASISDLTADEERCVVDGILDEDALLDAIDTEELTDLSTDQLTLLFETVIACLSDDTKAELADDLSTEIGFTVGTDAVECVFGVFFGEPDAVLALAAGEEPDAAAMGTLVPGFLDCLPQDELVDSLAESLAADAPPGTDPEALRCVAEEFLDDPAMLEIMVAGAADPAFEPSGDDLQRLLEIFEGCGVSLF
jgi:hypothetical protein